MADHIHMVLEPPGRGGRTISADEEAARRQTPYANRQERRSGTLREGRYKSSPIQTESYFLACCRYVELNPVRAGIVTEPGRYRWSS